MTEVSNMVNNNSIVFKNENIFPIGIVSSYGKAENAHLLLQKKELQITTNEDDLFILSNKRTGKNSYIVLDFGKELHGKIRILTYLISGSDSAQMRITYGESVSEALSSVGKKGASNDHSVRDFEFAFPPYSDMSFNESGFRFAKIELLSKNTSVSIKAITATAIYRDVEYLGSFNCSDETLNEIYNTAAYTCHLNMQQYIWDGIKRDRLVWVGDMHPEMLAVRTVFGNNSIIEESLRFMRNTTPLPHWMNGMPTYSLWWIIILWDWYYYSGNNDFMSENQDYALELIKIICSLVNDDGSDNLPSYFLDWPCNNKKAGISGSRALLAFCLDKSSDMAEYYEDKALSDNCKIKKQFLISSKAESFGAKQVDAFYSLSGWVDKSEAAHRILKDGCKGYSTFMSYYLLKAAAEGDFDATLNSLIEYYGAMLKMGATTFWEDFDIEWCKNAYPITSLPQSDKKDIHGDFGKFCYKGLRHSLCHGWSSGPVAFLAEEVLGIKISAPGCRKVAINPNLGSLEYAEGTYPTPFGVIRVKVRKENDGRISIKYSAPDAIEITAAGE